LIDGLQRLDRSIDCKDWIDRSIAEIGLINQLIIGCSDDQGQLILIPIIAIADDRSSIIDPRNLCCFTIAHEMFRFDSCPFSTRLNAGRERRCVQLGRNEFLF
jgi:hypothetical protein